MANDTEPVIISQWHGVPDDGVSHTVPPMAFTLEAGNKLTLTYRASSKPIVKVLQHPTSQKIIDLGTPSYDKWVDYVVHVKWDATGKTGVLQVWQDGALKVNEQNISIGYPELQSLTGRWVCMLGRASRPTASGLYFATRYGLAVQQPTTTRSSRAAATTRHGFRPTKPAVRFDYLVYIWGCDYRTR